MLRAAVGTAFVIGALAVLPVHPAAAASCDATGVTTAGYKLVRLQASGVSCAKARSVAGSVAAQLHRNDTLQVPGISSFCSGTFA